MSEPTYIPKIIFTQFVKLRYDGRNDKSLKLKTVMRSKFSNLISLEWPGHRQIFFRKVIRI